jgi:hypothetical protein
MKTLFSLLALLVLVASSPRCWAAGGNVTVATTAGGTSVLSAGSPGYVLWLVNTGTTNVADCVINGGGTVTSTLWDFQLQPNGGTWIAPQITYAPNQIGPGAPRVAGAAEGITCLAISGSTTVHWYKR